MCTSTVACVSDPPLIGLVVEALQLVIQLAAPCVLAAWLAGLLSALLQAALRTYDPVLSFVPKVGAVALVVAYSGAHAVERWRGFAERMLQWVAAD